MVGKNINTQRFEVLDSFRGIAALTVAIYHYSLDYGSLGQNAFIAHGHRLVEFFFVLSGFIIFYKYKFIVDSAQQISFLKKRFWRLYPLHLAMLGFFILFEICKWILYKNGLYAKAPGTINSIPSIFTNLVLLQGISDSTSHFSWNYPSWSISVEAITYVIFSFVLLGMSKVKKTNIYVLFGAIAIGGLITLYFDSRPFKFLANCVYCFFIGCITIQFYQAYIYQLRISRLVANLIEVFTIIMGVAAICYLPQKYNHLLPLVYSSIILIFSKEKGVISQILSHRIFIYLGTLSYSIYMTHALITNVMKVALINVLKVSPLIYSFSTLFFLIMVTAVSHLTYNYIELKGMSYSRTKVRSIEN